MSKLYQAVWCSQGPEADLPQSVGRQVGGCAAKS